VALSLASLCSAVWHSALAAETGSTVIPADLARVANLRVSRRAQTSSLVARPRLATVSRLPRHCELTSSTVRSARERCGLRTLDCLAKGVSNESGIVVCIKATGAQEYSGESRIRGIVSCVVICVAGRRIALSDPRTVHFCSPGLLSYSA